MPAATFIETAFLLVFFEAAVLDFALEMASGAGDVAGPVLLVFLFITGPGLLSDIVRCCLMLVDGTRWWWLVCEMWTRVQSKSFLFGIIQTCNFKGEQVIIVHLQASLQGDYYY